MDSVAVTDFPGSIYPKREFSRSWEWDIQMRVSVFPQEAGSWDIPLLKSQGGMKAVPTEVNAGPGSALKLSHKRLLNRKSESWSVLSFCLSPLGF